MCNPYINLAAQLSRRDKRTKSLLLLPRSSVYTSSASRTEIDTWGFLYTWYVSSSSRLTLAGQQSQTVLTRPLLLMRVLNIAQRWLLFVCWEPMHSGWPGTETSHTLQSLAEDGLNIGGQSVTPCTCIYEQLMWKSMVPHSHTHTHTRDAIRTPPFNAARPRL